MKLSDLLPIAKEEKEEFYWSLVIEPGWVQAGIWTIEEGIAKVVAISPGAAWEVDEDLVSASDAALSAAIQFLPEEFGEPQKTVFGLPNAWISKGQIKEEYLGKIKKICIELSLVPTGFVVLSEAVAHLIKSEEGAPVSAVILGVGKEALEVSVFNLGNLAGTAEVARSVSVAEDTIEGLARFPKIESFPSRFLIYDGKEGELEEAKQALLDANWDEHEGIKFLHTPKIEIVKPDRKILATSLAGASEIGKVSKVAEVARAMEEKKEVEEENIVTPQETISPEDLGFVVGADVSEKPQPKAMLKMPVAAKEPSPLRRRLPKFNFGKLLNFRPRLPSLEGGKVLFASIIIAVLFIIGVLAWWFLPTSEVKIYISPKTLEERQALTINTKQGTSNFQQGVLAGRVLKTEASGEKTISTTGTKLVGERAAGAVKVQNGLAAPINLPAGTVLTAANDLVFKTTETASVSAALSPANPGVANVNVAGSDIGSQYNLAKDESFKVGNYPKADVDAVSVADFTGGSSRQITAVSAEDVEKVKKELTSELLGKAKSALAQEISPEETFAKDNLSFESTSQEFNHKVGDESSNLKLSLTISVATFAVNKKEIFEYTKGILSGKVPSGYTLTENEVAAEFEIKDEKESVYNVIAAFSIDLLPEINKAEIAKKISGRYPPLVEAFFNTIPGFSRADIRTSPTLPGFLNTLPHTPGRIKISVEAEK